MSRLVFVVLFSLIAAFQVAGQDWSYVRGAANGPDNWDDIGYGLCTGSNQSPIDISAAAVDRGLGSLTTNWGNVAGAQANNNARYFELQLPGLSNLLLFGGPLQGTYRLSALQFHTPSEHTIFNGRTALEVQFIHTSTNAAFNSSSPYELAIVSVFYDEGTESPFLAQFVPAMTSVTTTGTSTNFSVINAPIDFSSAIPTSSAYYTYAGSLTTPNCRETVTWILYDDVRTASGQTLQQLGRVTRLNYRPGFDSGSRLVRTSSPAARAAASELPTSVPAGDPVPDTQIVFNLGGLF